MSRLRILICRVDDEEQPDQMTELHSFDVPAVAAEHLKPETALDELEAGVLTVGQEVMRRLQLVVSLVTALVLVLLPYSVAQTANSIAPLDVVISEIAWSGTATSSYDEWLELYNNTANPIDLSGWTLSAADGTPSGSFGMLIAIS